MDVRMKLSLECVDESDPIPARCVAPQTSLREVFAILEENHGGALVCHEGMLIGIFTERDALRALADEAPLDTPVGRMMTVSPVTVRTTTSIAAAVRKMAVGGYRRMPILDNDNRPVGVITTAGLVHYLVEQFARTIYNLPPAPTAAAPEQEGA
ncbi:MAG: CBS domain-containing protein [Pirellulales bacterium]